jgi:hypothetical protein
VEIDRENRKGRTYVGDWHTHPEASPAPSPRDIDSIRETFSESQLGLQGLILIIVGTTPVREDLYVGVCDRTTLTRLSITAQALERDPQFSQAPGMIPIEPPAHFGERPGFILGQLNSELHKANPSSVWKLRPQRILGRFS